MRHIIASIALLLPALAMAQDVGDSVLLGEDVRSMRFSDADVTGPTFSEGDAVTVLYVMGERLRVMRGNNYGWIPKTAIAPEAEPTVDDE